MMNKLVVQQIPYVCSCSGVFYTLRVPWQVQNSPILCVCVLTTAMFGNYEPFYAKDNGHVGGIPT